MDYRGTGTESEQIRLPKNIRQIGESGSIDRVYLEDYAVTYLHQVKAAVLLGEIRKCGGRTYYFINGALEVADAGFPEEIWEQVYREAKEYFEGRDVIGWYTRSMGGSWKITEEMQRVYREHFEGEQPVLILYDEDEEEEGIFLAENGTLVRQKGYYIYYEKNQLMQDYMVWKNTGKSVEKEAQVSDSAIKSFRKIIEAKTEGVREKTQHSRLVYGAGAFLVLTVFAIGMTMIQNYDKMKEVEQAVENMAQGATEPSIQVTAALMTETEETETSAGLLASMNLPEDTQLAQAGSSNVQADNTIQSNIQVQSADNEGQSGQDSGSAVNSNGTATDDQSGQGTTATDSASATGANQSGQGTTATDSAGTAAAAQSGQGITATDSAGTGAADQSGQGTTATDSAGTGQADQSTAATGTSQSNQSTTSTDSSETAATSETEAPSLSETEEALSRSTQAQYVIKEGDTLADVCEMYYGSLDMIDQICQVNNIENPNQILPGQKIVLP
ncbi:MAG: LysM peptidoglycan-binding domain-containing protein [Eubacteriales bacterium]|nr:LysM peptidoglycan-binding domain-containing protein [Eubacteriales bacterium]